MLSNIYKVCFITHSLWKKLKTTFTKLFPITHHLFWKKPCRINLISVNLIWSVTQSLRYFHCCYIQSSWKTIRMFFICLIILYLFFWFVNNPLYEVHNTLCPITGSLNLKFCNKFCDYNIFNNTSQPEKYFLNVSFALWVKSCQIWVEKKWIWHRQIIINTGFYVIQ